jgi:spore germination protein KA
MKNKAKPDIIQKVEQRLKQINEDFSITSGTIQNYIEEHMYSPFPQLLNTEKPERVSEYLIGGSVAVISEGSSTALLMPVTFFAFYQATDDIQNRVYVGSFQRLIRLMGFLITITLPAGYIALVSFHFEVIPIELVANVKGALENIPFPPLIEAIIMQITLELLRESAIRLPNPISQTISVVGGLVIGTAVVEANLVSNTMVIVIALTAISSFAVPVHEMGVSIRLLSFPLMILASILGFVGIIFGLILITFHLCRLETLGSPYFAPAAPLKFRQLAKSILKLPVKRSTNE